MLVDARDTRRLTRVWRELEREVRAAFTSAERKRVRLTLRAEARVRGQAHELSVAATPLASLAARFHDAHERRYGFADRMARVEVVTLEAGGWLAASLPRDSQRLAASRAAPARSSAWVGGRRTTIPVCDRAQVRGALRGPAVVQDDGGTLWVAPGWQARAHASGAIVLSRAARR